MRARSLGSKMVGAAIATGAALAAYLLYVRPRHIRWGATDEEVECPMPGDEVVEHPNFVATRAVTIEAAPEEVWPWLVQIGSGRAGFYSYDWIDNAVRPSAREIVPEYQDLKEGDTILDGPPGSAFFTVRLMEPNRAFVLYSDTHLRLLVPRSIRDNPRYGIYGEFSWAFVLEEQGETSTRLIVRTRANWGPPLYRALTMPFVVVGGEFFTTRKMLYGIKRRVERTGQGTGGRLGSNIEAS